MLNFLDYSVSYKHQPFYSNIFKIFKLKTSDIIDTKVSKDNITEIIKPVYNIKEVSKSADDYGNRIIFIILSGCFKEEEFETNPALKHLCIYGNAEIFNFFMYYFSYKDENLKTRINEILDKNSVLSRFIFEGNAKELIPYIKKQLDSGKTMDEILKNETYLYGKELFINKEEGNHNLFQDLDTPAFTRKKENS